MDLQINSLETMPLGKASVAFSSLPSPVFREDSELLPRTLGDNIQYMPWGGDNSLPYDILQIFEGDETMATCALFNTEIAYGSGLRYNTDNCEPKIADEIEDFCTNSNFPAYFFGVCSDLKMFAFTVSVIILSKDGSRITSVSRREACYCRFAPSDKNGEIPQIIYSNWRKSGMTAKDAEVIPLLSQTAPLTDLRSRMERGDKHRKFAILSKVPSVDSTYYPVPHYASLLKGKWYNIKRYIGLAKEAKLKNSAPIKYQIEIARNYWDNIFRAEGITERDKQQERVMVEKQNIMDFLTGAENSGKVWFSQFYTTPDGKEQHDVKITKVDDSKEGGDWATDIMEAVNMICFTMRVHSNLVGSVPGNGQMNNSGSDKRELHTIMQAAQKPYRDMIFIVHRLIIAFNGWRGAYPECPFMELTTLDQHKSAQQISCI